MSNINITYGTPVKLVITLTDLLSRNEKTFADITDVLFMLKANRYDPDDQAVFSKSVGTGIILSDPNIEINIIPSDYSIDKIAKNAQYLNCLAIEFDSNGFYIEDYDPKGEWVTDIQPDKIRA